MTEQTKPVPERKKLTITEVKEPRPVGNAEVLDFFANTGESTPTLKYGVWDKTLYPHIAKGATVDAEFVTTLSKSLDSEGNPYKNRKVTQLFIDDKPILAKKQWQPRGDSDNPERRAAILEQCRAKIISHLWIAGKYGDNDPLIIRLKGWLSDFAAPMPVQQAAGSVMVTSNKASPPPVPLKDEPKTVTSGKTQPDKDTEDLFPPQGTSVRVAPAPPRPPLADPTTKDEFNLWMRGLGFKSYNEVRDLIGVSYSEAIKDAGSIASTVAKVKRKLSAK